MRDTTKTKLAREVTTDLATFEQTIAGVRTLIEYKRHWDAAQVMFDLEELAHDTARKLRALGLAHIDDGPVDEDKGPRYNVVVQTSALPPETLTAEEPLIVARLRKVVSISAGELSSIEDAIDGLGPGEGFVAVKVGNHPMAIVMAPPGAMTTVPDDVALRFRVDVRREEW